MMIDLNKIKSMLILGITGGLGSAMENQFDISMIFLPHDAAAILIRDGSIIAAVEQERLDRIKHSDRMPLDAVEYCLETTGVKLSDVDKIAIYFDEEELNRLLKLLYVHLLKDDNFVVAFEGVEGNDRP